MFFLLILISFFSLSFILFQFLFQFLFFGLFLHSISLKGSSSKSKRIPNFLFLSFLNNFCVFFQIGAVIVYFLVEEDHCCWCCWDFRTYSERERERERARDKQHTKQKNTLVYFHFILLFYLFHGSGYFIPTYLLTSVFFVCKIYWESKWFLKRFFILFYFVIFYFVSTFFIFLFISLFRFLFFLLMFCFEMKKKNINENKRYKKFCQKEWEIQRENIKKKPKQNCSSTQWYYMVWISTTTKMKGIESQPSKHTYMF